MQEPANSFIHAALKLEWADVLLDNLHRIVETIKSEPHEASLEMKADRSGYVVKMGPRTAIPFQLPCLLGDFCHNCRSALDFAWMGLVRAAGNTSRATMPISSNRQGLVTTIGKAAIGQATAQAEVLLGDVIRSHQDFEAGGNRALAELNELSNWQKHNLLIPTIQVTAVHDVEITTDGCSASFGTMEVHSNEIRSDLFSIAGPNGQFKHNGKPTVDVFLQGPKLVELQPLLPALVNFRELATQGLKAFCEAFPAAANPQFE
jgi:hypothetical protein